MPEARECVNCEEYMTMTVTKEEWEAHVKRVESVFSLVEKMMTALASNPMFAGMLPPDLQKELRGL